MDNISKQFPLVESVNHFRAQLHNTSYHSDRTTQIQLASWLGHKVTSLVSLPLNSFATVAGCAGMAATASTLGVGKALVYGGSLGHIRPEFSIGFLWLGERTITSTVEVFLNLGELLYDGGDLLVKAFDAVQWTVQKLGLSGALKRIMKVVDDCLTFAWNRVSDGIDVVMARETSPGDMDKQLLSGLDNTTFGTGVFKKDLDQFGISDALSHLSLSVVNIPANILLGTVAGALTIVGGAALVAKVALHALTNIDIPIPTGCPQAGMQTLACCIRILRTGAADVGDGLAVVYRVSEATGLWRAVCGLGTVLCYLGESICT